jgi:hypothetical protein
MWQPVVMGDLVPAPAGTEIRLRMRMSVHATLYEVLWFGSDFWILGMMLAKLAGAGGPVAPNFGKGAAGIVAAVVGTMLLLSGATVILVFWAQIKKTRLALLTGRLFRLHIDGLTCYRRGHETGWPFACPRDTRRDEASRSRERECRREAERRNESLWLLPDDRLQVVACVEEGRG